MPQTYGPPRTPGKYRGKGPVTNLRKVGVRKPNSRHDDWIAAGRPKMADWVKSGAGIGGKSGPKGVGSSKLLQKRLAAESSKEGKQKLMNRYDKWLEAGRPKMAEWVKMGAGNSKGYGPGNLQRAAKNKLTGGQSGLGQ